MECFKREALARVCERDVSSGRSRAEGFMWEFASGMSRVGGLGREASSGRYHVGVPERDVSSEDVEAQVEVEVLEMNSVEPEAIEKEIWKR